MKNKRYRGNTADEGTYRRNIFYKRTNAQYASLLYYFGKDSEWFEGNPDDPWRRSRPLASRSKGANTATLNPPRYCTKCHREWHVVTTDPKRTKYVEYLENFGGIPMKKEICWECNNDNDN